MSLLLLFALAKRGTDFMRCTTKCINNIIWYLIAAKCRTGFEGILSILVINDGKVWDRFHKMHNKMGYEEAGEHPEVQQFMAHILESPRLQSLYIVLKINNKNSEHPEVQQFMAHMLKSLRYGNFI